MLASVMVGKMVSKDNVTSVGLGALIIDDYKVYGFKVEARV